MVALPRQHLFATLFLVALLAACAQAIDRAPLETTVGTVPVRERNYELGRFQESYVGAPMIRVRDYVATKVLENVARASHDFTISGGFIEISGRAGDLYPIVGKTDYEGRNLTVVDIDSFGIMVDGAGKPVQKVINMQGGNQIVLVYTFTAEPPELTFARVSKDRVDASKPFVNYEIIYTGRVADTLRLNYREYSADDLARTAFFQELTYPADQKTLRFRDIRMEVDAADSEKIRFRVVED